MDLIRAGVFFAVYFAAFPVNASDCFCLVDEDDNFRYSCEEQRQGIRTVTLCRASDDAPVKMTDLAGWQRLQKGEGRCRPCQQRRDNSEGGIRGQDEGGNADE